MAEFAPDSATLGGSVVAVVQVQCVTDVATGSTRTVVRLSVLAIGQRGSLAEHGGR